MRLLRAVTAAAAASVLTASGASACTTFCLTRDGDAVFGRNYDFEIGDGMLLVNQRGVSRTSLRKERPARWVSAFGSVTFNQFGRDLPMGGMNERGLVVELMWLDATRYPPADDRPETGVLEWIQMQLDLRDGVDDLLAHLDDVRIAGGAPLHYLVADPSGAAATVEFLDGRPVVHTGGSLPIPVLANDTYASSLGWLRAGGATGQEAGAAWTGGSLERFGRAARMLEERRAGDTPAVPAAFEILSQVAQGRATRWSIVYDMRRRETHFRTAGHSPIRSLSLDRLDLSCGKPVMMLGDLNAPLAGDVRPHLIPWTHEANLKLVSGSYRQVSFLKDTPREEIEAVAAHPLGSACSKGAAIRPEPAPGRPEGPPGARTPRSGG